MNSAVLDACVLLPRALRDVLLRAAEQELYLPLWTDDILEGLRRNLVRDRPLRQAAVGRLIVAMRDHFPEATVGSYQALIPVMRNAPGDRHVLAAAVAAGAPTIVTSNLRHFPHHALAPYRIDALSPDAFLSDLLGAAPDAVLAVVRTSAAILRNPPKSASQVLDEIAKQAPNFAAAAAREFMLRAL